MEDQPLPTRHGPAETTAGPREQLAAAYDQHAAELYRYALLILADSSAAQDAVQQAFAKLAAMGDRIGRIGRLAGYLRRAVRNESYRLLRRRGRRAEQDLDPALLQAPEGQPIRDGERQALERALRALPARQREVVHMKVYEQKTFQQIAEWLHIPLNTAASRYRYAIEKLRELLEETP